MLGRLCEIDSQDFDIRDLVYYSSSDISGLLLSYVLILNTETFCFVDEVSSAKVARKLYRQRRDVNSFLSSNPSVSRTSYLRILMLAGADILLTLPLGIVDIYLNVAAALSPPRYFPFYPGWDFLHNGWAPVSYSYAELQAQEPVALAQFYFTLWTTPVLAFAIFGLFGLTREARASYRNIYRSTMDRLGSNFTPRWRERRASLGEIEFGTRQKDSSGSDFEQGCVYCLIALS